LRYKKPRATVREVNRRGMHENNSKLPGVWTLILTKVQAKHGDEHTVHKRKNLLRTGNVTSVQASNVRKKSKLCNNSVAQRGPKARKGTGGSGGLERPGRESESTRTDR